MKSGSLVAEAYRILNRGGVFLYPSDARAGHHKGRLRLLLDALPLSPSGKVDRRALPPADPSSTALGSAYVAPRSPIEEALCGLWREVLDLQRVGAEDNFFELGGHSLLATQLISRVRDVYQVELPLRELFEHPTVASLAAVIERVRRREGSGVAPPMAPVPRGRAASPSAGSSTSRVSRPWPSSATARTWSC